jgi:hypothetical protein
MSDDILRQVLDSGWWIEIDGKDCKITLEKRPDY